MTSSCECGCFPHSPTSCEREGRAVRHTDAHRHTHTHAHIAILGHFSRAELRHIHGIDDASWEHPRWKLEAEPSRCVSNVTLCGTVAAVEATSTFMTTISVKTTFRRRFSFFPSNLFPLSEASEAFTSRCCCDDKVFCCE